jgi:adenylyl cyclase-associated protein
MGALEGILERLEAVATRLESAAGSSGGATVATLSSGGSVAAPASVTASSPSGEVALPSSVASFDALLAGPLRKLTSLAAPLGPEIVDAASLFEAAFAAERHVIAAIAACKKPADMGDLQALIAPVGEAMSRVFARAEGRRTDAFNHYKAMAEAVQALSFVAFQGPDMGMSMPVSHVSEAWQSAEFYGNKILMEHKAANPEHVAWVRAFKELVSIDLKAYVKEHHITGPTWNPKGGDLKAHHTWNHNLAS